MLPFERVQHAVLASSFFTLVWTGFALKYPDQWWARPLLLLEGARSMRSLIHRVAAVDLHGVSRDAPDFADRQPQAARALEGDAAQRQRSARGAFEFRVQLGLGDQPPARSAHSYIEKAEYWAVVWGAIVMIATGVLLWANNIAMKQPAEELAGCRHFRPLLRGGAGDPRHRRLALLLHHFRSRCLSAQHRVPDRR